MNPIIIKLMQNDTSKKLIKYPTNGNNNLCLMHAIFGDCIDLNGRIYYSNAAKILQECKEFAIEQINELSTKIPSSEFKQFVTVGHWNDLMNYLSESANLTEGDAKIMGITPDEFEFLMKHQQGMVGFSNNIIKTNFTDYIDRKDLEKLRGIDYENKVKEINVQIERYGTYSPVDLIKKVLAQVVINITNEKVGNVQPYIPLGRFIAKMHNLNLSIERENDTKNNVSYPEVANNGNKSVVISYNGFNHFSKMMTGDDYKKLPKDKELNFYINESKDNKEKSIEKKQSITSINENNKLNEKRLSNDCEIYPYEKQNKGFKNIFSDENKIEKELTDIDKNVINTSHIYLNPEHILLKDQSLTRDQINIFFKKNTKNLEIKKVYNVYNKANSSPAQLLTAEDVNILSEWAKAIFIEKKEENKEDNNPYENITTCGENFKTLLTPKKTKLKPGDIDPEIKAATFSMHLYITCLIKCYEINSKINNNDNEEVKNKLQKELEKIFQAIFSSDLESCAGGMGSVFMTVLTDGVTSKIIQQYTSKFTKYINEGNQTHLRPFITDIISEEVDDHHKDSIHIFLTRKELEELISALNSGDFFTILVKDVLDIYQQIISCESNHYQMINLITQDHYLFNPQNPILDSFCLIDGNGKPHKTEADVIDRVTKAFLDKNLFHKIDDIKRINSQQLVSQLITLSIKNPFLFFYYTALEADILDESGNVKEESLQKLLSSSNGTARFKEFAKKRITSAINTLRDNKDLKDFLPNLHINNINSNPTKKVNVNDLQLLIENQIPLVCLKKIVGQLESEDNSLKFTFLISTIHHHPEWKETLFYLKSKGIKPDETIPFNFMPLIDNKKIEFIETIYNDYTELFPIKIDLSPVSDLYVVQKLEFINWAGTTLLNLKNIITENIYFICNALITSSSLSDLHTTAYTLMLKHTDSTNLYNFLKGSSTDQHLIIHKLVNRRPVQFLESIQLLTDPKKGLGKNRLKELFELADGQKQTVLHYMGMQGTQQFLETIQYLLKENGLEKNDLKELLSMVTKEGVTPLSFLAYYSPQHFLETLEYLLSKNGLEKNDLKELLSMANNQKMTPLHFLANFSPQHFLETLEYLLSKNGLEKNDLKELFELADGQKQTVLHYMGIQGTQHFLETIQYLLKENGLEKNDLKELLSMANNEKMTPLHFLANFSPQHFLETLEYLLSENGLEKNDLKELLSMGTSNTKATPLHFLAVNNPKQFLESIQLLTDSKNGLGKNRLKELLSNTYNQTLTPLHVLPTINPHQFFETIQYLFKEKVIEKKDLIKLLSMTHSTGSPFHILATTDQAQFYSSMTSLLSENILSEEELIKLLEMTNNDKKTALDILRDKKYLPNSGVKIFVKTLKKQKK